MKRLFVTFVLIAVLGAGGFAVLMKGGRVKDWLLEEQRRSALPPAVSYDEVRGDEVVGNGSSDPLPENQEPPREIITELPASQNLAVPFTPQAPFAVWDEMHDDACEEASILMVAHYKQGKPIASPQDADAELEALVELEMQMFGYFKDTTAEETVRLAKEYYGFQNSRLVYDFTVDDVKREIASGNPVIVPAAGRMLHNPYFRGGGPPYHMLVVRGYTADGMFITNDPGTKRGEEYTYTFETILDAAHDWNSGNVEYGKRVMIVLE